MNPENNHIGRPGLSRRNLIIGSIATGGGLVTAEILREWGDIVGLATLAQDTLRRLEFGEDITSPESTKDVFTRIQKKYDIEIPWQRRPEFTATPDFVETQAGSGFILVDEGNTASVSLAEAKIIENALDNTPSPGSLVQVILPYRFRPGKGRPNIAQGTYMGRSWRLELAGEPTVCTDSLDRPLDPASAVNLLLPAIYSLSDLLPDLSSYGGASVYFGQKQAKGAEQIPNTTQAERLRQVVIHEIGHGLDDQISWRAFPKPSDHCDNVGIVNLCGLASMDENNPLYKSFATVNGWKLMDGDDILRSCGMSENLIPKSPPNYGWVRDPNLWGDPPRVRISRYATEGNISEAFAEFFMASRLYPWLLTKQERRYFDNIAEGLSQNPEEFLQTVAARPDTLLAPMQ